MKYGLVFWGGDYDEPGRTPRTTVMQLRGSPETGYDGRKGSQQWRPIDSRRVICTFNSMPTPYYVNRCKRRISDSDIARMREWHRELPTPD